VFGDWTRSTIKGIVACSKPRQQQMDRTAKRMGRMNLGQPAAPTHLTKRKAKLHKTIQKLKAAGLMTDEIDIAEPISNDGDDERV
jgi:hypothetical protein